MDQIKHDWFFHTVFALLAATCHIILAVIHNNVPLPYMDEQFHVPQVRAYCNGNFTQWDPMITTLPGLYIFTVGLLKPMNAFLSTDLCTSVYCHRYINVIFSLATFYVASLISHHKLELAFNHPNNKDFSVYESPKMMSILSTIEGLVVCTFPVLFFFTFLYYTDQGAVFLILLSYFFHLHHNYKISALCGGIAIMFRQTNVVWVVFIAISAAIPTLSGVKQSKITKYINEDDFLTGFKENFVSVFKAILHLNFQPLFVFAWNVLQVVWSYVVVVVCFVYFVLKNQGITVGAKDDHQASMHIVQIFYFSIFSFAALLPHIPFLKHLSSLLTFIKRHIFLFIFILLTIIITIHFTTLTHKYLVADNRHYTFYLWRNVFQRHWSVRYVFAPVYIYTMYCLWKTIKPSHPLWKISFIACVSLAVIPSPLIELRYFITAFILLRLNIPRHQNDTHLVNKLCLEVFMYTIVNTLVLLIFVNKPFLWPDSTDAQRFMY